MYQKSFSIFKNPQLLNVKIIPFLLITFFSFFFSAAQSIFWNSTICVPQYCGNNTQLPVQYPFWIPGRQKLYCGSPQFDITCKDDDLFLNLSGDDYIIRYISYEENLVFLARPEVFDQNNNCPVPRHNFSVLETPFEYGPNTTDLYFFYNCSKPCDGDNCVVDCPNTLSSYACAVVHTQKLDDLNESCQAPVKSPVWIDDIDEIKSMDYKEVLKQGFSLKWNGSDCQNCNSNGNHCGSENGGFICFCEDNVGRKSCGGGGLRKGLKMIIGFGAAAGGTAIVIVMCLIFCIYQRNHNKSQAEVALISHRSPSYPSSNKHNEKSVSLFGVHIFTYNDLEAATDKFDQNNIAGDGGFGTVYKGKLRDGRIIAVKRMYENNFRMVEQFLNEVEMLRRLRHRNLVMLYGCTSRHSRELLLVYEYISNGTVADHLRGPLSRPGSLPWITRMSIATETASALAYLHASDVIHTDVKTNNILLDDNFCVKVADFGLSRLFPTHVTHISTAPQGTPGYVDPEYRKCYHLTDRSDVFSFGVVLIELISSKPAVDITRHRHEINLSNMAMNKIQNDELHELVDPELGYESDEMVRTMIDAVAKLSFRCLQLERDTRPSMEEVFKTLQDIQSENHSISVEKLKSKKMCSSTDILVIDSTSSSITSSSSS